MSHLFCGSVYPPAEQGYIKLDGVTGNMAYCSILDSWGLPSSKGQHCQSLQLVNSTIACQSSRPCVSLYPPHLERKRERPLRPRWGACLFMAGRQERLNRPKMASAGGGPVAGVPCHQCWQQSRCILPSQFYNAVWEVTPLVSL